MRAFIISTSLVLALTQVGLAEGEENPGSANHFMPGCRAAIAHDMNESGVQVGACIGFIGGVVWGVNIQSRALHAPRPFCIPDGVQGGDQLIRVVVKYIDQRPEVMHRPFAELVYLALKEVWPCNR
jgi:hypothetical protein